MAKFNAGQQVERLEYDFTAYGGKEGFITEPTTGKVNQFFGRMRSMLKDVQALQNSAREFEGDGPDLESASPEEMADQVSRIDEASAGAEAMQHATIANIAILCGAEEEEVRDGDGNVIRVDVVGGSPTYQELEALPHRVLQAFSTWLMMEIRPKKTTPGSKR